MLFKQIQLLRLAPSPNHFYDPLIERLKLLTFQPCLPSLPISVGWVPPIDKDGSALVEQINQQLMICMQVEERILPAAVVRHAVQEKVKQLEASGDRRVGKKEKNSIKDEVVMTLLPRSFSKFRRIYAYLDIKNNWLVIGSTHKKSIEQFLTLFKKTVAGSVTYFEIKKIPTIITQWVNSQDYPEVFTVEKKGVLQDPNQKSRVIRCQEQDLFVKGIQEFIKDGCELKQLALRWRDSVRFVLSDDMTLRNIKFEDELIEQVKSMEAETRQQKFMADFFMFGETVSALLQDLLMLFAKNADPIIASEMTSANV